MTILAQRGLRSQILSGLLSQFSSEEYEPLYKDPLMEEVFIIEVCELHLPSTIPLYIQRWGKNWRIVLYAPDGTDVSLSSSSISLTRIMKINMKL